MFEILIGTDPEVFLRDKDGRFVSAHGLIRGTKEEPCVVPRGAIQLDGVALEFNTEPARTADEFVLNIKTVMASGEEMFKGNRDDLEIAIQPTATFEQGYFDGLPEDVKLLGCTPDFNAYTGEENDPPETSEPFRTGAGHIHVGWGEFEPGDDDHFELCCRVVRQLDSCLFLTSLLWDDDQKRRSLYGKVGAFRPKPYGVEYRPLSNSYLQSVDIQKFVFNTAVHAAHLLLNEDIDLTVNPVCKAILETYMKDGSVPVGTLMTYQLFLEESYGFPVFTQQSDLQSEEDEAKVA